MCRMGNQVIVLLKLNLQIVRYTGDDLRQTRIPGSVLWRKFY